ncbi:MAG: FliH/SctL family protein [Candidatus Kapaibacterium sp.]|jgi:flagellar biosynthesis/type III secretory pathway protein FliH|nr:FliH/SctL family protein [Candidatus Kapabacteria bacterium]
MSEITINITKNSRIAKVSTADLFPKIEFSGDSNQLGTFLHEHQERRKRAESIAKRKKELAKKVIFTEKFVVANTGKPVQISLKNVNEPVLSIEEAKVEVQNAYDKGFSDGQEAASIAYNNDKIKYLEWVTNLENLSLNLKAEYSKNLVKLEKAVIPVAITIAKYLIRQEITQNPDIVIEQLNKAMSKIDDENIFKISVHPDDFNTIQDIKGSKIGDKYKIDKIEIAPDENISRGGCILHTDAGIIDATIEAQLEKFSQNLSEIS